MRSVVVSTIGNSQPRSSERTSWYLYSARFVIEILDVTDPKDPKQVKYLLGPPNTAVNQITIHDNLMITGLSRQTQDVLVDTRGYVYITDSAWGIWILRYTGPDQPAPTAR